MNNSKHYRKIQVGRVLYELKKRSLPKQLYNANGGILGILAIYLLCLPFLALMGTACFYLLQGQKMEELDRDLLYFNALIPYFGLVALTVLQWLRQVSYASKLCIVLCAEGIYLQVGGRILNAYYMDVKEVYYGSKSETYRSTVNVAKVVKPGSAEYAQLVFNERLTIETKGEKPLYLTMARKYFIEGELETFLGILQERGVKVSVSEYLV